MPCQNIKKTYNLINAHEIYNAAKATKDVRCLQDYDENLINSVGTREQIDNQIKSYIADNPSLTCYEYCIEFFKIWNNRLEKSNIVSHDPRIQALWECIHRKYIGRLLKDSGRDKNDMKAQISKDYTVAQGQLDTL